MPINDIYTTGGHDGLGFIKYGSSPDQLNYTLPFPSEGGAAFETQRTLRTQRNANNALVGQMVGRSMDKQTLSWNRIEPAKWWEFNRFLEASSDGENMFFWVEFFNYNLGKVEKKQFYADNPQCEPMGVDPITLQPRYLANAKINVMDTGA